MTDRVEGGVLGAGAVELYWQGWLPASPRGVLLLCHGLGEHAGRYGNVVDAVVPDGWAVYGLDQRGHGRSGGHRAHVDRYADLLIDFDAFRRAVVARHPGLPVVLLGHSMGGQIALAYALDHQAELAGLVLSAPALAGDVVPKPVVPLLRALGRVAPRLRPAGIDVTKISKDPAVVAAYRTDPLVHHGLPEDLLTEGPGDGLRSSELAEAIGNDPTTRTSNHVGLVITTADIENELQQITAVEDEFVWVLQHGAMGKDWETFYNEFREKLNAAGYEKVVQNLQAQVDAFMASK